MLKNRVIPCLQLLGKNLVKTVKFEKYSYIGDPLNTCRIFNELEVDEMVILDIRATVSQKQLDYEYLNQLTNECFMPLAYGGGIKTFEEAQKLFRMGFEKIIINSALFQNIDLLGEITEVYGSQSVISAVDVRKDFWGKYQVFSHSGRKKEHVDLYKWLEQLEKLGVGEILLTDITNEGTWKGFDIELIKNVTRELTVPLIMHGGAGCKKDVEDAVNLGGASAIALGSMVVYQQKDMGVLINYQHDYNFHR